jgi:hypothetical protein
MYTYADISSCVIECTNDISISVTVSDNSSYTLINVYSSSSISGSISGIDIRYTLINV